jgi:hypothetical protein
MADNTKILEFQITDAAYNTVRAFIGKAPTGSAKYSLRADSYIVKDGAEEKVVHILFFRDGTESIFKKIYNWYYADKQRTAAKELLCKVIMNGYCSVKIDAKRERMLNRIKKMERIVPDENLKNKVLYDLDERKKRAANIEKIALKLDEKYAEAVRELNEEWGSSTGYKSKFFGMPGAKKIDDKEFQHPWGNHIAKILDETSNKYLTQNFFWFISYAINESLLNDIDYGLVEKFCKKWLLSKTVGTSATNFAELVGLTEAQKLAVEAAVQQINAVLGPSRGGSTTLSEVSMPATASAEVNAPDTANSIEPTFDTKDEKGIIKFVGPEKTSTNKTSYSLISYVVQGISMLPSFKNLRTGRSVFASENPVCAIAHSSAVKRPGAKKKRAIKKIKNAIPARKPVDSKKAEVRPLKIEKVKALAHISLDYQPELDIRDIGTGACILVRDTEGPGSTSKHFGDWRRSFGPLPETNDGKCTVVKSREEEVVIFAKYQVGPLNSCLTDNQISYLEEVYRGAVEWAVSNGKSILLTDVFCYDELTVKRCVYAMLAPIRDAIALGKSPAVHIRVTSKKLCDEIKVGLESSLRFITPLSALPLVERKQIIDKADLVLPGMMMVTQETKNFFKNHLDNPFSNLYEDYEKDSVEKIRVRAKLSNNSITRLYFFAKRFDLDKNGAPRVQKISDEYAELISKEYTEFFKAAQANKCLYVTIELLWVPEKHQDKDNKPLLENLCDVIKNANKDEPSLKVCIVTKSDAAAAHILNQFPEHL